MRATIDLPDETEEYKRQRRAEHASNIDDEERKVLMKKEETIR